MRSYISGSYCLWKLKRNGKLIEILRYCLIISAYSPSHLLICHLTLACRFNRFDFPPIFHREEDTNPEELWVSINLYSSRCYTRFNHEKILYSVLVNSLQRESGRPPIPRKRPTVKMEEQSLLSDHPYVDKACFFVSLHVSKALVVILLFSFNR